MKIEHAALYVLDLEAAREFFIRYFGAKPGDRYHNPRTGFSSYFLSFEQGARLELMHRADAIDAPKPEFRTGYAHIAFSVGSKQRVDDLSAELSAAGFTVLSGPRTTGDGYYESCIVAFEDNLIELTV